jgi:peptidoglycan/LPS O-acetylase OafA/YrhL
MAEETIGINAKMYRPELDGLRFLAFLAVFIHHAPNLPLPNYEAFRLQTWAGVDVFLCLSAFLFVHLLGSEWRQSGTIQIKNFYIRRALRIWPVYFLYVALMALIIFLQLGPTSSAVARVLGSLTFTNNILDAISGYEFTGPVILLLHLWSISYEEQFYLAIPWFLRLMFSKSKQSQLTILAVIFAMGLAVRMGFIALNIPFPAVYVLPITHLEPVLLGLLIGLGVLQPVLKRLPWWATALAAAVCFWLVSLLPYYMENTYWLMLTYILVGLGSALCLLTALQANAVPALRWLSSKPMVYLGKISYGLYLYHFACLYFWRGAIEAMTASWGLDKGIMAIVTFVLALLMTYVIAALSYRFIEKPFLRLKEKYSTVSARPI